MIYSDYLLERFCSLCGLIVFDFVIDLFITRCYILLMICLLFSLCLERAPLRSGCVTHLKRNLSKTVFLLSTCLLHCGTFICLLSVGNSINLLISEKRLNVDFRFLGKHPVSIFLYDLLHSVC